MSFSSEVKTSLTRFKNETVEADFAELYGFVFAGASLVFVGRGSCHLRFKATGAAVASRIYSLVKSAFSFAPEVAYTDTGAFGGRREYRVTVNDSAASVEILRNYELLDASGAINLSAEIQNGLLHDETEYYAFLRGVLLSCGALTDPVKSFSLEFRLTDTAKAEELNRYLTDLAVNTKIREMKNAIIVYTHGAEDISAVLAMCGAHKYALDIQSRIAAKDMKNRTNRIINFETSNWNKTVEAACNQEEAIEKIIRLRGMNFLSEPLIEAAQLRLEHHDASLKELAAMAGVSRSTFDKRMRKIITIAKGLK